MVPSYCMKLEKELRESKEFREHALKREMKIEQLQNRIKELEDVISRSNLTWADEHISATDSCGKPVFQKTGKRVLQDKDLLGRETDKSKTLQKLAAASRRIAELEDGLRKIYEKADIRGYEGGHAGIAYWCEKLLNLPRQR